MSYVPTISISGFSAALSHSCHERGERVARCAAHERDLAGADVVVDLLGEGLAERARVLADDGRVVLAGAGHVTPCVRGDGDPCRGRLLEYRQILVADVREVDDHVGTLCDDRLEVRQRVARAAREDVGALVDDLADLRVRQRLEDELHLRHLAVDVLAERLHVRDGQLSAGARVTAVVLPALERQVLVDGVVRACERRERDLLGYRILRQERRVEERLLDHGRVGIVGLAVLVGPRPAPRPSPRAARPSLPVARRALPVARRALPARQVAPARPPPRRRRRLRRRTRARPPATP